MKKIYLLLSSVICSLGVSAQVIWTQDFSSASGSTPPTGWTITDLNGSGVNWVFDNPAEWDFAAPITDPAAILDSDFFGEEFAPEDAVMTSPVFNASTVTGGLILEFDHTFYQYENGLYEVEVFDGTAWNVVLSGDADTEDPQHESINITAAADGAANAQVRFHWTGSYDLAWIVDNITLTEVSCAPPSVVTVSAIDDNSADITWTAGGSETSWNIEYGEAGFTPGAGTPGTATGTPTFTVPSLDAETEYEFYVQADCGSGEESTWFGPYSFTTTCVFPVVSTFPWTEDFDGVTDPDLPCGWVTEDGNNDEITWLTDTYAPQSGANALVVFYNEDEAMNDWIYTPELVLQTGTSYRLTFSERIDGDQWPENLEVKIGTSAASASMTTPLLNFVGLENEEYIERHVDFTVPANGSYHIGFHGYSDADMSAIFVDDVTLALSPSCIEPTNVVADDLTSTGTTITWTPGGSETTWNIEYGEAGFTPGAGTSDVVNGTPEYDISALDPNTEYDFYIQSDCGAGDASDWTMISFSTECSNAAISTFPWTEDFDAEELPELPCGWMAEDVNNDDITWITDNYLAASGENALSIQWNADEAMNDWAYSPELALQSGVTYQLSFNYASGGLPENLGVFIGSAQANATMTTELTSIEDFEDDTFAPETVTFTVPANGSYYLGFHGYSEADQFVIMVDDVSISLAADCDPEDATFTLADNSLCTTDAIITPVVTGDAGGVFTGTAGLTVNASTGAINPATSTVGAHVLTYITSTTECADTMTLALTVAVCSVGLNENALTGVEMFPNPTNGLLHVISPAANGSVSVAVVDFTGKTVLMIPSAMQGAFDLDLGALQNGVYFVKLQSAIGEETHRVVLTK